ncbi:MAG: MMPL family transporter [Bacteroidales bacterium]
MEKLADRIIRFRWLIIGLVLFLTLLFGYQLRNLRVNSDILSTLPDNDPTGHLYKRIGSQFGGNDVGMIVLETDQVFRAGVLEHVRDITDSLQITPGVSTVTSLTHIMDIRSSDWGIEIGWLVDPWVLPSGEKELDSLRTYVASREMYSGVIVSEDQTATAILFTVLPGAERQAIAVRIQDMVKKMDLPETVYFGGLPFMLNDITDLILSDMIWLIPIVFVIIALILFLSFRSVRGMILPLLTAGITVVWTLGAMAWIGFEITIITNMMPVVLLALGSAYTIHVLNSINQNPEEDRKRALVQSLSHTLVSVILAALTTVIGFVSFVFGAYLTMIKEFGISSALGILFALLLSVFFVPALISAFSLYRKPRHAEREGDRSFLYRRILEPLTVLLFKRPVTVLVTWVGILVLSLGGIFLIRTSVNITEYFKPDNPTRVAEDLMQRKFGGSLPVFVEFEGDMQDPRVLNLMVQTAGFMETDPNIRSAQSVADLVEQMNDAMGEGKRIPAEKAKIEQLWFLLDGQDVLKQLVSEELDRGIIQSRFASIETKEIQTFTDRMDRFVEQHQDQGATILFTGIPPLYVKLNSSLVRSQYSSLLIALVLTLAIIGAIMRSLSKGLVAIVPIVATILLLLGSMGFAGIPLDIATVLVGSIALGIGIDYSIHVITGYHEHMKRLGDAQEAIRATLATKGKAVIINVVSVAAGFLVLRFAQLLPIRNFGVLIAISMVGSGLGALTLLPVILLLSDRRSMRRAQKQSSQIQN